MKVKAAVKNLLHVLLTNGYTAKDIHRIINLRRNTKEEIPSLASWWLPYVKKIKNHVSKLLKKIGIRKSFTPPTKSAKYYAVPKIKYSPCELSRVYMIPSGDFPKVYVAKRSINTRKNEYDRYLRLKHPERSILADHALTKGHTIGFDDTRVNGIYNLIRREALEILQHPDNLNKDDGYHINQSYVEKPVLVIKPSNQQPDRCHQSHVAKRLCLISEDHDTTAQKFLYFHYCLYFKPRTRSFIAIVLKRFDI